MRRVQRRLQISGPLAETSARSMLRRQAEKLQLVGWVQQGQGSGLELVVNGPERTVQTFISWIRGGPLRPLVAEVTISSEPREAFFEFSVRQPKLTDTDEQDLSESNASDQ